MHSDFNDMFPFSIVENPETNDVAAEAIIYLGDDIIGYVGGSRYSDRVIDDANAVVSEHLRKFYAPVIEALKNDPRIDASSRFTDYEDYLDDPHDFVPRRD